jgi:hypothetical protein
MDTIDTYLSIRCLLLADDLERLDRLGPEDRRRVIADAAGLLDLLSEVLLEPDPADPRGVPRGAG